MSKHIKLQIETV